MPKYDEQTLRTAANKALENAGFLIEDAKRLAQSESYGPAISLLIIGREEAQKALLLTYCATGVYDPSSSEVGKEIAKALGDHEYRHDSAWYVHVLGAYILSRFAPDKKKYEEYLDWLKRTGSPKGSKIEKLRWRGLYVDIDRKGRVLHPRDLTQSDFSDMYALAIEHSIYVAFVMGTLKNAKESNLQSYHSFADDFLLLKKLKPLTHQKIADLESKGTISEFMIGFCKFIIKYDLDL